MNLEPIKDPLFHNSIYPLMENENEYLDVLFDSLKSLHGIRYDMGFILRLSEDYINLLEEELLLFEKSFCTIEQRIRESTSVEDFKNKLFEDNERLINYANDCFNVCISKYVRGKQLEEFLEKKSYSYSIPAGKNLILYSLQLRKDGKLMAFETINSDVVLFSRLVPIYKNSQDYLRSASVLLG